MGLVVAEGEGDEHVRILSWRVSETVFRLGAQADVVMPLFDDGGGVEADERADEAQGGASHRDSSHCGQGHALVSYWAERWPSVFRPSKL